MSHFFRDRSSISGARTGAGVVGGWTPAKLPSIAAWFRADQQVTLVSNKVSNWGDLTGNAHDVSQGTSANRPDTYNTSDAAYNNKPTIQSSGGTIFLQNTSWVLAQPMSVLVVGEFSTTGASFWASGTGSQPFLEDVSGTTTLMNAGFSVSYVKAHNFPAAFLTVFNGASSLLGVSDWLTGGVSGNAGSNSFAKLAMFSFGSGTLNTAGKIAEFIVWSAAATSADKTNLAAYILARYNITVT